MNRLTIAILLLLTAAAAAQQNQRLPRIGYVFPAGGRQGTSFEVDIGGQFLDGVRGVKITGEGVTAELIEHTKSVSSGQASRLNDELKELNARRRAAQGPATRASATSPATRPVWTVSDEKRVEEIRRKLATFVRKPSTPALAESVAVHVTLDPKAPPGDRLIRLRTKAGLTNAMIFRVGTLPEFAERPTTRAAVPVRSVQANEMRLTLPATANGQIMPGGVDRYRFAARGGQNLVIIASARELIPYLADAVPGWFQATLALYDTKGKELAYDDDFRFNPDPVLQFRVPRDGEYIVEIKDAIYRGREDFVYRLSIGELPFITGIFPLGGRAGEQTAVELRGWNLPTTRTSFDAADKESGVYPLSVRYGPVWSNRMSFAVDTLPESMEREPNNDTAAAQSIDVGTIINGRIDRPGDWDVFRIDAKAGEKIVAEVLARRLSSPLDSVLRLVDSAGKQITFADDLEDKTAALHTHHADSYLLATLPADGTYYLWLGDVQRQGGPEFAYRLRVGPPRPDFDLRVAPCTLSLRGGATALLAVHVVRRDGFDGEILLSLKDAPPGFFLSGASVPRGVDQVSMTLNIPTNLPPDTITLQLVGTAQIDGRSVVRAAVPVEDMMQAFAYRHLVPADALRVTPTGRGWGKRLEVLNSQPAKIPAGGQARVRIGLPNGQPMGGEGMLVDPPEGVSLVGIAPARGGVELTLAADGKCKVGLCGNLIVNAVSGKKGSKGPQLSAGYLPAIPFEIVPAGSSTKESP